MVIPNHKMLSFIKTHRKGKTNSFTLTVDEFELFNDFKVANSVDVFCEKYYDSGSKVSFFAQSSTILDEHCYLMKHKFDDDKFVLYLSSKDNRGYGNIINFFNTWQSYIDLSGRTFIFEHNRYCVEMLKHPKFYHNRQIYDNI